MAKMAGADKLHLLGHEAELFRRQVIKLKNKSPVKVAISVQRPVVDISLLFVLLHTRHPAVVFCVKQNGIHSTGI